VNTITRSERTLEQQFAGIDDKRLAWMLSDAEVDLTVAKRCDRKGNTIAAVERFVGRIKAEQQRRRGA
jgi:hypothetical protein